MISIKQLNIKVKGHYLLKDINLEIHRGRVLTIIGESSSGKSTLAQALLGHYCGNVSGEIQLDGRNILQDSPKQIRDYRRHQIAMLTQSTAEALNPQLTVMKHVLESHYSKIKAHQKQAQEMAEQGLTDCHVPAYLWHRHPRGLSGGEIQRVLLAIALINNPSILVLDEPSAALDKQLSEQLQQQILALAANRYIIWVSHNLSQARQMPGDIAVLHQGELVEYNQVATFFAAPQNTYSQSLLAHEPNALAVQPIIDKPAQKSATYIQIKSLSKAYGHKQLFKNLDFTLSQGEIVALFGQSGIGKSTLACLLCRRIAADSGRIHYCQTGLRVAWISQHPIRALPPHFSLFDAVAEPLVLQKQDKVDIRHAVLEQLKQVKLDISPQRLKQRIKKFSGGELQRVAIARALIAKPDVIIADEITATLDRQICHDIIKLLLRKQQQEGLSILFITHDETLGKSIAHRCLRLHDGQLWADEINS